MDAPVSPVVTTSLWSLDDMCILTPQWGCNGGGRNNSAQTSLLEGGSGGGEVICS